MNIWIIISSFLVLLFLITFIRLQVLKRELRKMKNELAATRDRDYNRQITVSLFDRDLETLAGEMNQNLDYQKHLKYEAEQSEKQLRQSISDIAHDLRTPLTVIRGNLQMMEQRGEISEKAEGNLKTCQDKCDVLKDMVDDFFEMSVLESDSTPAELTEVNITNLLMQFIIDHEAVIREHDLTPDVRLPQKSIFILADEQMVTRMLGNLLGNVIKYARNAFTIELEIQKGIKEKDYPQCRIIFSNRIESDDTPDVAHLFDRAYQGGRARTASGAGLGLYIVKLLAEKQSAQVFAEIKDKHLSIGMIFSMKSKEIH